jgi:hypothetical protein
MAIEVGREYRLELGTTLGTALTVTGISKASEAVVTAVNTLEAGDYVFFGEVQGMVELSYIVARVKTPSGSAFTLEGVDSTAFGTWTSGACQEVTAWSTVALATSVDFGSGSAEEIDVTVLLDSTRQVQAGLLAQPTISVNVFSDYSSAAQAAIDTRAYASTVTPFRATKKSGHKRLWAGIPSTIGESVNVNSPITGSFTIINRAARVVKYTT